jgi:hypothetical protein
MYRRVLFITRYYAVLLSNPVLLTRNYVGLPLLTHLRMPALLT